VLALVATLYPSWRASRTRPADALRYDWTYWWGAPINKAYREGGLAVEVLRGADLAVAHGEVIAVVGASGPARARCCIVSVASIRLMPARFSIGGRDLARLSDVERGRLRNQKLGFVYQFHHLLPEFTALDNVAMRFRSDASRWKRHARLPPRHCARSVLANDCSTTRPSFRAASVSEPRLRARSLHVPTVCSPMNPPATLTAQPRKPFLTYSCTLRASGAPRS